MSDDSDDVVFIETIASTSSTTAKLPPKNDRLKALTKCATRATTSQGTNASSVLLTTWIDSARREEASAKRMEARRKAAGVTSPAKRPKLARKSGKTVVDTITLDDDDEEQLKEAPKKETNFQKNRLEVAGSLVTAAAASILSPISPNKKISPANSQASQSQSSRVGSSAAPSICDEETQENDESLATESQEARRRSLLRECLRVDDGRDTLRDGEVVRNRADRAVMHGQDCPCCSDYYNQLDMSAEERQQRIDQVSRHRYVARPMPRTPPHYWDMDFPTKEQQKARGMLSTRMSPGEEEKTKDRKNEEEVKIKDQPENKE
ncbi:com-1 [Pristionchus pacificus]|uniref:Com-1 n=1 Tax=Pristionchus pacificus TaxID=54126 RepID=A0A2A6BFH8_PRIPA|nr:com-1 [Pristionchus pacificus]|eukprot:PDM64637.1 com-1 [Pristionchus pacificus]